MQKARIAAVLHPIFFTFITLSVWVAPLDESSAQTLNAQIEMVMSATDLGDSRIGVFVQDADTGEVLASIRESEAFIPASNMKLLTTGAALEILGPEFMFRTELRRSDDTIILRGSGDPALGDPDLLAEMGIGVEDLLTQWVKVILASGDPPPKDVVIDANIFDRQFVHPSWPKDQLNRWYAAEVAGVNFYTNVIGFYLARDQRNTPPRVMLEPDSPWLRVRNRARTVSEGGNTVWVARPAFSNEMTIYGDLRQSLVEPVRVALHDPPGYLAQLLAARLESAGLERPDARVADENDALPDGNVLAVVQTTLQTIVRRCNVESHNLYAEALLKKVGHAVTGQPGSFANGAAVLRMTLQDMLGPADAASTIIADGSGLSRNNQVSPRAMGRWLRALANDPTVADVFIHSLPIAGAEGTLARRFEQQRPSATVYAKSGYIEGVSCLSGYVVDEPTGRTLVFSVLVNDIPQAKVPIARVKKFQEAVVALADGWLSAQKPGVTGAAKESDLGGE